MILTTANQAQGLPVSLLCPVGSYPSFITVRGAQLHSEPGWYTIQLVHNYYNHEQQLKEGYKAEQSRTSRIRWKQSATPFVSGSAPDRWVQCQLLSVPIHQISLEIFIRAMQWSNEQNCEKTAEKCTPERYLLRSSLLGGYKQYLKLCIPPFFTCLQKRLRAN